MRTGEPLDVGTTVEVFAGDHAIIHGDVPVIPNAGYLIGGRLLHPGDSLTADRPVDDPCAALSAPWMAVKEAIDYFRGRAAVAIPIHEKVLANPAMVYGLHRPPPRWLNLDDGHFETCDDRAGVPRPGLHDDQPAAIPRT